eukprot:130642_1
MCLLQSILPILTCMLSDLYIAQRVRQRVRTAQTTQDTNVGFEIPDSPEQLLNYLNVAMSVELSTIPLYMTAMLSFKDENLTLNAIAAGNVLYDIIMEEMLHMALVSNLISSVFGSDIINVCYNIPYGVGSQLPANIHSHIEHISLKPYSKESLWTFIQIEAPVTMITQHKPILLSDGTTHYPFEPQPGSDNVTLTFLKHDSLNSIGELYTAIQDGLILLSESNQISFSDDNQHIQRECQHDSLHNNITQTHITSLQHALNVINLIKIQGEGYELDEGIFSAVTDIDNDFDVGNDIRNLGVTNSEKTHFIKFIELLVGRKLISLTHINETFNTVTFQFIFKGNNK